MALQKTSYARRLAPGADYSLVLERYIYVHFDKTAITKHSLYCEITVVTCFHLVLKCSEEQEWFLKEMRFDTAELTV